MKKVEIAIGLLLAAALFIMPSLVRADPETPQTSQPNDDQYDGYEAPKIGSDVLTTDRSRAGDPWGIAPMPPGYAEEVLPGPLSPTVTASSTEPYPFSALNARVQAIADRLSEDDDDDSPIRNAFVHGPEELDDLGYPPEYHVDPTTGSLLPPVTASSTDRSRASDPWGIAPMPPGYAEEVLPGPLSPTVTASSTEPYPFSALNARVQAIADRLSEDDDDDSPIRNAFVHGPEELDDLVVPVTFKDSVDHYIAHFTIKKRKMFASWLRRARQYAPLLTKILREQDLPEDLVYLAMIESGFNPKAYSPAKASGPWQFISETGQRYGLRIDHWVDERRDFEKATVAAARYLRDLFERFGCWYLAASGYNAGEGRVEKAIRRHRTSDYWELYRYNTLPRETREYIPQLIAAAAIAEDPARYGFAEVESEEANEYQIKHVPGGTPLRVVATAADTEVSEIKSLNPELLTGITPPKAKLYAVKLPSDASLERFDATLKTELKGNRVVGAVRVSSSSRRSLARTIRRYGTSKSELALVNQGRLIHRKIIYVPLFDRPRAIANTEKEPKLSSYRVKTKLAGSAESSKRKSTRIAAAKTANYTKASRSKSSRLHSRRTATKRSASRVKKAAPPPRAVRRR